jgi:predicted dithiol-disulfide oxidoreductase (DUF899 family)
MPTTHATGSREEWLTARLALLDAEKELTRRSDELARQRLELPWVRIEKEYRFDTDDGEASLKDVYHTYSTFSRGVDGLWVMYQWLDRAPLGRNEGAGNWFRRHDEYDQP